MPGDSSGEDLPTHVRAKDGTQTQTSLAVHSREFCPDGAGCTQHMTSMGDRRRRLLKPCSKCGGPRFKNIRGFLKGTPVALCGACKDASFPGKPPQFLRRAAA